MSTKAKKMQSLKEILTANKAQIISYLTANHNAVALKYNMIAFLDYATDEWSEDIREASDILSVINDSLVAFSAQYNIAAVTAIAKADADYTAHIIGQDNRNAAAMHSAFGGEKYAY